MKITKAQALAQGFTVDHHCYPNLGYKGPRFNPIAHVEVLTETEAELLASLEDLMDSEGGEPGEQPEQQAAWRRAQAICAKVRS